MAPFLEKLTLHWQLKLAAFGLALLLWVVLSADQVTSRWLQVPIEVDLRNPNYDLAYGPVPQEVEVRFTGPGREILEVAISRPRMVLPITEVDGQTEFFVLDPQMVRLPRGLTVSAQDVRPSSVRLGLTQLASREVPVVVQLSRGVQEGYVLLDSLVVNPARVRVTGPAEQIGEVSAVYTRPLDLSREDSVFVRSVPIDTTRLRGLRVGRVEVEVSGNVDRIAERVVTNVAVVPPPGMATIPQRVEVLLRGPERVLRTLAAQNLRAAVPADQVPAPVPQGGVVLPVRAEQLPAGVAAEVRPAAVRLLPLLGTPAPAAPAAPPPADTLPRPPPPERDP